MNELEIFGAIGSLLGGMMLVVWKNIRSMRVGVLDGMQKEMVRHGKKLEEHLIWHIEQAVQQKRSIDEIRELIGNIKNGNKGKKETPSL